MRFFTDKDKKVHPIRPSAMDLTSDIGGTVQPALGITAKEKRARILMKREEMKAKQETKKEVPARLADLPFDSKEVLASKIANDVMKGFMTKEEVLLEINQGMFDNDPDVRKLAVGAIDEAKALQVPTIERIQEALQERINSGTEGLKQDVAEMEVRDKVDIDIDSSFGGTSFTYTFKEPDEVTGKRMRFIVPIGEVSLDDDSWLKEDVLDRLGSEIDIYSGRETKEADAFDKNFEEAIQHVEDLWEYLELSEAITYYDSIPEADTEFYDDDIDEWVRVPNWYDANKFIKEYDEAKKVTPYRGYAIEVVPQQGFAAHGKWNYSIRMRTKDNKDTIVYYREHAAESPMEALKWGKEMIDKAKEGSFKF